MLTTAMSPELQVYSRLPFEPDHGSGSTVITTDGRRLIDLYGGHAVAVSGHCHPKVVAAVRAQAERLLFYSNAVHLEIRERLNTLLTELTPDRLDQVFLVNSGAEANEIALQLARRASGRRRVVCCEGGFHGRSLATLAVSGVAKYRKLAEASGGQALVDFTTVAPFDRPAALASLVDETVAAVIIEPIQGVAGARDADPELLRAARRACDESGAFLIFDEVQCGCGRAGAFTAAEAYGVTPDALTLAKGIAAGLPMGAVMTSPKIAVGIGNGDLGSTFGGAPLPCAAAVANLEVVRDECLADNALVIEHRLRQALADLPAVTGITGRGLILGLALDRPARAVQMELLDRGYLVGTSANPSVIRLLPPLVLTLDEAEGFSKTLHEVLA